VLTDDSAAEQLAVKGAFRGVKEFGGEKLPDHFLCTVHSDRTLRRNIADAKILKHIRAALYHRKTEAGAKESIGHAIRRAIQVMRDQNPDYLPPWNRAKSAATRRKYAAEFEDFTAINSSQQSQDLPVRSEPPQRAGVCKRKYPDNLSGDDDSDELPAATQWSTAATISSTALVSSAPSNKQKPKKKKRRTQKKTKDLVRYLWNEWYLTRRSWAAYARQHSPLLLQITTTNCVETWHASLKRRSTTTPQMRSKMSLKGCIETIFTIGAEYEARAENAESAANKRQLIEAQSFPQLLVFPYALQKRIIQQLREAILWKADPKIKVERKWRHHAQCDCKFYNKYLVPCRHIWYRHLLFNCLTDDDWQQWRNTFEDSGLEVYEHWHKVIESPQIATAEAKARQTRDRYTLKSKQYQSQLNTAWFNLLEGLDGYDSPDLKHRVMRVFLEQLNNAISPLLRKMLGNG
jgi:hypothetical protein